MYAYPNAMFSLNIDWSYTRRIGWGGHLWPWPLELKTWWWPSFTIINNKVLVKLVASFSKTSNNSVEISFIWRGRLHTKSTRWSRRSCSILSMTSLLFPSCFSGEKNVCPNMYKNNCVAPNTTESYLWKKLFIMYIFQIVCCDFI